MLTPKHFSNKTPIVLSITLILGTVIWFFEVRPALAVWDRAGSFCMEYKMRAFLHTAGAEMSSQSRGCCCRTKAGCCDVSQDPSSELSDVNLFAVPREKNPVLPIISVTTINVLPHLDFPASRTNKFLTLGMDPPVPLFLLNLSLLH